MLPPKRKKGRERLPFPRKRARKGHQPQNVSHPSFKKPKKATINVRPMLDEPQSGQRKQHSPVKRLEGKRGRGKR